MWKFKFIKEFALSSSYQDIWILCRLSCCELDFFIAAWQALCCWECQSVMVQVMVCCLNAPSHYLHWCGISISNILCQSPHCNFMWNVPSVNAQNYTFQITAMLSRDVYGADVSVLWIQQSWFYDGFVLLSGLWWAVVIMATDLTLCMMIKHPSPWKRWAF